MTSIFSLKNVCHNTFSSEWLVVWIMQFFSVFLAFYVQVLRLNIQNGEWQNMISLVASQITLLICSF